MADRLRLLQHASVTFVQAVFARNDSRSSWTTQLFLMDTMDTVWLPLCVLTLYWNRFRLCLGTYLPILASASHFVLACGSPGPTWGGQGEGLWTGYGLAGVRIIMKELGRKHGPRQQKTVFLWGFSPSSACLFYIYFFISVQSIKTLEAPEMTYLLSTIWAVPSWRLSSLEPGPGEGIGWLWVWRRPGQQGKGSQWDLWGQEDLTCYIWTWERSRTLSYTQSVLFTLGPGPRAEQGEELSLRRQER